MASPTSTSAGWLFESRTAMARWAGAFAKVLRVGDVIALIGPLGAGKTTLTQDLVGALGYRGPVTSPTFALANEYPTPIGPVYHMDMYRLSPLELKGFPFEDYWSDGVSVVEWADKIRDRWPNGTLEIQLSIEGPGARRLRLRRPSTQWTPRLTRLPRPTARGR